MCAKDDLVADRVSFSSFFPLNVCVSYWCYSSFLLVRLRDKFVVCACACVHQSTGQKGTKEIIYDVFLSLLVVRKTNIWNKSIKSQRFPFRRVCVLLDVNAWLPLLFCLPFWLLKTKRCVTHVVVVYSFFFFRRSLMLLSSWFPLIVY